MPTLRRLLKFTSYRAKPLYRSLLTRLSKILMIYLLAYLLIQISVKLNVVPVSKITKVSSRFARWSLWALKRTPGGARMNRPPKALSERRSKKAAVEVNTRSYTSLRRAHFI